MTSQQPKQHLTLLQFHMAQQHTTPHQAIDSQAGATQIPMPTRTNLHTPQPEPASFESITTAGRPETRDKQFPVSPDGSRSSLASNVQIVPIQQPQRTASENTVVDESSPFTEPEPSQFNEPEPPATKTKAHLSLRIVAPGLLALLAIAIYLVWRPALSSNSHTALQTSTNHTTISTPRARDDQAGGDSTIKAYIVGAVHHPGVYTLPADARVLQLIQAAGGPLPRANLVAINLAAKLQDGQEVYLTLLGEKPPTYVGGVPGVNTGTGSSSDQTQLTNLNTADITALQENLHISSKTAQSIIDYREQHGTFTSIEELLTVVSASIYTKIKDQVTI